MKNGLIKLARAAVCVVACFGSAQAAPTSPQVVAGQATFSQQGNVFSITNTPGAIINWQSFNVNANEITRFIQQSGDSAVLNRIVGQDPSRILGALQSNGKVFLINPNGIVFGQGARVDVGGLVASTLNISDSDFLAGNKTFTAGADRGTSAGTVRNDGAITTSNGGKVYLVATSVENNGIVNAPNGDVVLAAGRSVKLVDSNNPDLDVVVSAPQDRAVNLGQVVSSGGRIGIYGALVNQRGVVNANSAVVGQNGKILLKASADLTIESDLDTNNSVRAEAGNDLTVDARIRAGGDIDLRAGNRLTIGAGGELRSANYIDLQAERMTLAGRIRGQDGQSPIVSFTTFNAGTAIGVGGAGDNVLLLDPARLADIEAFGINIGSSAHRGEIVIDDTLRLGGYLSIDTAGNITVRAPVELSGVASQFTATLHPRLGGGTIAVTGAGSIRAGKKVTLLGGAVRLAGDLNANDIAIEAGDSGIELNAGSDLLAANLMTLRSNGGVYQNAAATIGARSLLASGVQVQMLGANRAATLAGNASNGNLRLNLRDAVAIGTVEGVSGLKASNEVSLTGGVLSAAAGIEGVAVFIDADAIGGSGLVKGAYVDLVSRGGIGSTANPLRTSANVLNARNTQSGNAPINIVNDRAVTLRSVVQAGAGNGGAISIDSTGGLTVAANEGDSVGVRTGSGNISLVTHSPMTIAGKVTTDSGNIRLLADNGGALTIAATAQVASGSGNVSLTGGTTSIAPGTVQVSSPDKLSVTNTSNPTTPTTPTTPNSPVTPPALDTCIKAPGTSGCAAVLETKTRECIANMDGPQCAQVLPSTGVCQTKPQALGCAVVLQRAALLACIANPKGAGCGAILPSIDVCRANGNVLGCAPVLAARQALEACIANPKGPGCGEILPTFEVCRADGNVLGCAPVLAARQALEACIANPKGAGCGEILPTFEACRADGNVLGCAPVLAARQALEACIVNPKGPGCGEILPTFEVCRANGNVLGCAPVLAARQALEACIANPAGAACGEILPPLAQCRIDAGILGCAPVLARAAFDACLVNPTGAGCVNVLPSLPACKAAPNLEGCAQVLQLTFDACLAKPGDASCSGVLPTLSQCVIDKSAPGCQVVLPTLQQCIGSPTLQGCSVQLPTLAQCASAPTTAGCQAVLPNASYCSTHPSDAACAPLQPAPPANGQGTTPVAGAQQAAVNLINTRTPTMPQTSPTPPTAPAGPAPGGASAGTAAGTGGSEGGGDGQKAAEKQAGPAQATNTGAKNEKPAAKMYCN